MRDDLDVPSEKATQSPVERARETLRLVVVVPTFNNVGTLPRVLGELQSLALPACVVNDGSSDGTAEWLAAWAQARPVNAPARRVVTHAINRGKAAALLTGFAAASAAGFTHTVTIDADGQLDPGDIPALLEAARRQPGAMIVGFRDDRASDYPASSRIGRRMSNLMIRLECGAQVHDSQCGLRVYPLRLFELVRPRAQRYGMETEIITLASWAGVPIVNIPVSCRYVMDDGARCVSHFSGWRETWRGISLHARLMGARLRGHQRGD